MAIRPARDQKAAEAVYQATGAVVDRLGKHDFYDRLLDLIGRQVPHDLAALVRYSKGARPDLVLPRIELTEVFETYRQYFYALDPFFHHWREVGEEGVFRLRSMASDLHRTRYAREFLRPAAIYDEIAVFLPKIGDASPTLILDRASGAFSEAETARIRALYPLLASLHRRHISLLVLSSEDNDVSPLGFVGISRIVDQHGQTILTSKAWEQIIGNGDPDMIAAIEAIGTKGPCSVAISQGRMLRRTRLPGDFGPAPNGYFDELVAARPDFSAGGWRLPSAMADKLTKREGDIVELTLKGYPIVEIARRLGISRGTVKNYRHRIYEKFDITTERELFIEYNRLGSAG
jgi:DNA-binding CsgD family transcriptional regulator